MGLRLIAVACLVGAAFAGPFQRQSEVRCATSCAGSEEGERFKYEPGQVYTYDYKGINYLKIAGQRKQKAQISGRAEIHVISKCDMILQLRSIRIDQRASHEETSELMRQLEVPMPFAFEDGKIDHVCSSQEESTQSQNIKKGILSSIINTMTEFDVDQMVKETDSLGTCATKYTVKQGRGTVVQKSKDLKSCTNRHTSVTSLITNPYEAEDSEIHTVPIFPEEKLTCEQEIEQQIIKNVKCKEYATIKPFRQQDSIIEFEGEVELRLRSVTEGDGLTPQMQPVHVQHPILYNLEEDAGIERYERQVEELLKNMCQKNSGLVDATISKDFFDLVSFCKHLPYESLEKIYRSLENGQICSSKKIKDVFVDALPMAGSAGSIKLMVKLLVQKKVVGVKSKLWTISLAFIRKPTDKTLSAVVDLLKKDKSASVLLGVSAMVGRHCQQHPCERSQAVKQIVSELSQAIGRQCSYDDEKEVIAILKAFGNMGYLGEAQSNILACTRSNVPSIQVRLAAIDSFRRTEKVRPRELLSLFSNSQEHYEVRIAALSSIIRNADMQQIQAIENVIENEKHEQVASYAATLITNVKKSSSPSKKTVRNLLQNVKPKMPANYWTSSKNIELSTFSDPLNVGGSFEADLIHNPQSLMPRSLHTRFDIDLFGSRMNMFEMGVRADGLEELMKKVLRLKSRAESSSESGLQASIYLRTMGIEFFEVSASDLTGLKKMLQAVDVMNQISHEKTAEFSHSFLFMNSKLVIPSVTGRSYSFGVTGSATVGLTASSKFDVLNLLSRPRNGDIHGRFKPSCNVEMAATVGMHSNTGRPDMKIVTVLHSESDIEARFQLKEGHLALASLTMPSDNVLVAKMSSNVIEINPDHSEKLAFGEMHKKIDSCIPQLEKPFGLTVCGKWEVPRPFFDKKFPYVRGIGNVELSIKKTDPEMKGYEFKVEIPKREADVMIYQIALDTPQSRISRRFSGDLKIRKTAPGSKEYTIDLKSPFKSASARGSCTMRNDLVEGNAEVLCGSKRISVKASTQISDSTQQKVFKPSLEITLPSSRVVKLGGEVSVSKGRKQQVAIDIKSNVPQRRPLSLKGTLTTEGRVSTSKDAEWKVSSDIGLIAPVMDVQLRGSIEKQSKQSQALISDIKIDYQRERSQKHTVMFSKRIQQSASKLSTSASFEMTQFPSAKLQLQWSMQGKLRDSLKNDITLKYGRNPEKNYITVLHSSQMPRNAPGECRLSVKAPEFHIDSELKVSHEYQKNSKISVETDLRYKQEKHIKCLLNWEKPSRKPLKQNVRLEVELPSQRKLMYQDEVQETSPGIYEGNSLVQWQSDRRAELKYKVQKQNDRSTHNYEIETTLRLPQRQSPIKSKASLKLGGESIAVEGRLNLDRSSEHFIKAHLNKKGSSHLSLKVPQVEAKFTFFRELTRRAIDMDLKMDLLRRPRHIIASSDLNLESKKKLKVKVQWDADRNPNQKMLLLTQIENTGSGSRASYSVTGKLQVTEIVNIDISASGDSRIVGRHETQIEATVMKSQPIGATIKYDLSSEGIATSIKVSRSHSDKLEVSAEARLKKNVNDIQLTSRAAIKSLDSSFESKEWSSQGSISRAESSLTVKSHARLQWAANKIYESEVNYDLKPSLVLMKALLHTPHIQFEKQAIGFSLRRSRNVIASSATLELLNGKVVSVSSEINTQQNHFSYETTISSPFQVIKAAKIHLSFDNESSQKSGLSYIELNGERKIDSEAKMITSGRDIEIQGRLKSVWSKEVSVHIQVQKGRESFKYSANVMKESSNLLSASVSKQTSSQDQQYSINAICLEKPLLDVKYSKQLSQASPRQTLEAHSQGPVSFSVQATQNADDFHFVLKACRNSRRQECYHVTGHHKAALPDQRLYKKVILDIEKSVGQSESQKLSHVLFVISLGSHDFREKIMVSFDNKNYGYEIRAHLREHEKEPSHMDAHLFMPSRTARVRGTALHNSEESLIQLEIFPDASSPQRKFGVQLKKQNLLQTSEIKGNAQIIYPGMQKPLQVSGQVQIDGKLPVRGKLEMHYSPSSWNKVLTLEISPELEGRRGEKKAILYRLHREDQSLDLSVKLIQRKTRAEDVYGYEYHFKTSQLEQTGGLSIKLSEKSNGKPTAIEVSMNSPEYDVKIRGSTVWSSTLPKQLKFSIMAKGQKVYEVALQAEDYCLTVDQSLSQGPLLKTEMCFNKVKNGIIKIVYLESYYKQHKCLDLSLNIDRKQRNIATIVINWDKEDLRNVMNELRELESVVMNSPLGELLKEVKKDLKQILETIEPIYEKIQQKASQMVRKHSRLLKDLPKQSLKTLPNFAWTLVRELMPMEFIKKEVVKPIVGVAMCIAHKYVQYAYDHIPDVIHELWKETNQLLTNCVEKVCTPGTYCHMLVETYKRGGVKKCTQLLQNKVQEIREKIQVHLPQLPDFRQWIPDIRSIIPGGKDLFPDFRVYLPDIRKAINLVAAGIQWFFDGLGDFEVVTAYSYHVWVDMIVPGFNKVVDNVSKLFDLSWWVRKITNFVKERSERIFEDVSKRELYHKICHHLEILEKQARVQLLRAFDILIEKLNELIQHTNTTEEFETIKQLLQELKERAHESWENKEALMEQTWQPLRQALLEDYPKNWIKQRFTVQRFNPKEGHIQIQVHYPSQSKHIQIMSNALRAIKSKVTQRN
ncbi:apolipophorins-like [Uloborus diversus]|uniref:apolipophorins-like n=1 Tax=Uloborus diversus TaxID=327109 RepID=UPI00240979DD|nr:apolipophorins-like [Uloborus diversus]